jgi:hypothetical protein
MYHLPTAAVQSICQVDAVNICRCTKINRPPWTALVGSASSHRAGSRVDAVVVAIHSEVRVEREGGVGERGALPCWLIQRQIRELSNCVNDRQNRGKSFHIHEINAICERASDA